MLDIKVKITKTNVRPVCPIALEPDDGYGVKLIEI
jgi:hypothetical protein